MRNSLPLVASIVKAAYEAAAQHTPVMVGSGIVGCTGCKWNAMEYPPFAQHIRALTPEYALLGARLRELEARRGELIEFRAFHQQDLDGVIHIKSKCAECGKLDNRIADLEAQIAKEGDR